MSAMLSLMTMPARAGFALGDFAPGSAVDLDGAEVFLGVW
jgi:hypothetical protein